MALLNGGKDTTIEPGLIQRILNAPNRWFENRIANVAENFFPPLSPLPPQATPAEEGRAFDYPIGYNLNIRPKQAEGLDFKQMRQLADAYAILRLVIETRKDQIEKLKWVIKPRIEDRNVNKDKSEDPRIKELTDFFLMPDKEHTWGQWLRMILEDIFVIDAPCIYIRKRRGGGMYSADPVDGATIKRVIDYSGRTPLSPDPAYQQVLKGLPATNYTTDKLIYFPRNIRTDKVYGYSPVEQILMMINIGLRRDVSQLAHYTDGNIPAAFAFTPDSWTPQQIKDAQLWHDSMMQGNIESRRKIIFLPAMKGVERFLDPKLKDEYDEWLARIVCFCFSISPLPFVRQMNRSTSETQQETAKEEGLVPLMMYLINLMNVIILKGFGYTDIEFAWLEENDISPETQANINALKVKTGMMTLDEWRESEGKDPLPNGEGSKSMIFTSSGAILIENVVNPPQPIVPPARPDQPSPQIPGGTPPAAGESTQKVKKTKPVEKLEKANKKKIFRPLDLNSKEAMQATRGIKLALMRMFRTMGPEVADQINKRIQSINKAQNSQLQKDITITLQQIDQMLKDLDLSGFTTIVDPSIEELKRIYAQAATKGYINLIEAGIALGINDESIVSLVNKAAMEYAQARGAELVGMKYVDGELIENPNAQWAITDSTREMLRTQITAAIEQGWSSEHLKKEILNSRAFDEDRAETIARTEIKTAASQGNINAYTESGVALEKAWSVSADHDDSDECDGNEAAGWIDLQSAFPSGNFTTGAHPRCNCALNIRLKESK